MKICRKCGTEILDDEKFCPNCGEPVYIETPVKDETSVDAEEQSDVEEPVNTEEAKITVCPNCNKPIENGNSKFCQYCGAELVASIKHDDLNNLKDQIGKVADKVENNKFVKSIRNDLNSSESVSMIKNQVKKTANKISSADKMQSGKIKKIVCAVAAVLVLLIIVTNIHQCEECDKVYFGKKYTISFWGESEDVCKDCYTDFYSWDW